MQTNVDSTPKRPNDRRYIALPPELHDELKAVAARQDRTLVAVLRRMINAAEVLR